MPGPIGDQVNGWLRTITGLAFAGLWVAAAWHVRSFRGFVVASLATLLAVYWLLSAWIWPWYVIWALPLAALVPASWAARTAAVLSATILTLHISSGFEGGEEWWFYTYRSLPAFVLPIVIVAFAFSASRLFSTLRRAPGRIQHALLRRGERFGSSYQNNGNAHDRAAA